jgi:hypothetical protein
MFSDNNLRELFLKKYSRIEFDEIHFFPCRFLFIFVVTKVALLKKDDSRVF